MWVIFALCFYLQIIGGSTVGYYRVVGSQQLRPQSDYHVAVSTQGTSLPTTVTVAVSGRQNNGRHYAVEQSLYVEPYTTRVARLEIGDIGPGDYKLVARGNGGISFNTMSPLNYTMKSYSVFIQTDRQIYEPGLTILFRALVLNVNLRPAAEIRKELLNIQISDGNSNIVKKWQNVEAIRGVFSGELMLSRLPVFGDWTISVTIHGQTFNKTVQVVTYVLPKFRVDIQTKKHVTFSENTIVATIQSRYNYGKKLKGLATITMFPIFVSGVIQPIFQTPIRKVLPIDGSVTVEFDISKDIRLNDEYERTVIVDVIVEEALTERRQNNSAEIFIHKYEYHMDLIKTSDYYKPGLKYTAFIKVSNHDGSPLKGNRSITIRHGYSKPNEILHEEIHKLNMNGILELTFYPPKDAMNQSALRIEGEYMNLKEWFSPVPAAVSSSKNYIQTTLLTTNPTTNQEMEILINCTEPVRYLSYELFGRGDVLIANTIQTKNEQTHRFHFTATQAMVPTAHLVVSYIRADGELIADSLNIDVDGLLNNFVDVQTNSAEVRAGSDVDIIVHAQPNSYVGLMAIDQNVINMKTGHDITRSLIVQELLNYDASDVSPYFGIISEHGYFPWKPGNSNSINTFKESGAVLQTNSEVNTYTPTLEDIYLRTPQYDSSTVKPDRGLGIVYQTATRPPLAGPYAFSRIPTSAWNKPKIYLSDELQNAWLFNNFSSGFEGKTSIRRKVPDSLTNWVLTAFSLDPLYGLGLVKTPRKLKVSTPFAINIDLPYSVQRGETIAIPVVIHNYEDVDINAEINFHNTEQKFVFMPESTNPNETQRSELFKRKFVKLTKNSGTPVSFMIKPVSLGNAQIKVTVTSVTHATTSDAVLHVKAEGETQYYTKSLLVDLRKTPSFKKNITIDIPKNLVPGSLEIEISVVGDLLGLTIMNMDNLIQVPTGCGEQNLLHLISNVIVLDYLTKMQNLGATMKEQCIVRIESAYQQQLSYKHKEGSFSLFGPVDKSGSIWLTALVAQSLKQAQKYIYIDEHIIINTLNWLASNQAVNGSFTEIGDIVHRSAQRTDKHSLALTSLVALAFWENKVLSSEFSMIVQRSLDYVARNIDDSEDIYTIALSSYALHLTKHSSQQIVFNLLELKAQVINDTKFWAEHIVKKEEQNPWHYLPKSLAIETTAYGLLTYVEKGLIEDSIPVLNWLLTQQNTWGGFTSTRDTAVALHALSMLMGKITQSADMQIKFTHKKQESKSINVNRGNSWVVQHYKVSDEAKQINISAEGSGMALFQVSYKYNLNVTGPWPMFTLDPRVNRNSNLHHLQLSICSAFVGRNLSSNPESNMAIMEVNLPSGFTADVDSLPSLAVSKHIKLVETKNKGTTVVMYFDKFKPEEYCPTVSAFRTHAVARQKPVAVLLYDYYDTSRQARVFYLGPRTTLCDICEGENCESACAQDPRTRPQIGADTEDGKGAASSFATENTLCIFFVTYLLVMYL